MSPVACRQRAEEGQWHWQHVAMQWQQQLPPPSPSSRPPRSAAGPLPRAGRPASDGHGGVYDAAAQVGAPDEAGAADWEEEEEEEGGGRGGGGRKYTSKPGWPPMDHDDECGPLDGGGSIYPSWMTALSIEGHPTTAGVDDDGSGEWDGGGRRGCMAAPVGPRPADAIHANGRQSITNEHTHRRPMVIADGGERPTVWGVSGLPH